MNQLKDWIPSDEVLWPLIDETQSGNTFSRSNSHLLVVNAFSGSIKEFNESCLLQERLSVGRPVPNQLRDE